MTLNVSDHALKRMKQRGISPEAIRCAIMYGIEREFSGALIYNLTKAITEKLYKNEHIDIKKYHDLKIVLSEDNYLITAYRKKEKILNY